MKIAVLIIAYKEERYIERQIMQWNGLVDKILVLVSARPWNGMGAGEDRTADIARNCGVDVVVQDWRSEYEQRNWGLARLYDYDYILVPDPDEFFTTQGKQLIFEALATKEACYRISRLETYWKNTNYVLDPPDKHQPIIAVNPKRVKFFEHRQPCPITDMRVLQQYQPVIDVVMHHFSWVRSDEEIKTKINSYSHADIIPSNWYYDTWLNWSYDPDKYGIRPYGRENSRVLHNPAPPEIRQIHLLTNSNLMQ